MGAGAKSDPTRVQIRYAASEVPYALIISNARTPVSPDASSPSFGIQRHIQHIGRPARSEREKAAAEARHHRRNPVRRSFHFASEVPAVLV